MDRKDIWHNLTSAHIVDDRDSPTWHRMSGGVSSDIWLLETPTKSLVVKRALPQLKVAQVWKADVRRNIAEQKFSELLSEIAPDSAASLIYKNEKEAYFVMEYLGPPWSTWKAKLLQGYFDHAVAVQAATLLAKIHNTGLKDSKVAGMFDHKEDFYNLRLEPYLMATGQKYTQCKFLFEEETSRLAQARTTIVHGDFSPKNILINGPRMVLIDHEVVCIGDPSFDVAFFINHLMLKSILHPDKDGCNLAWVAWHTYFDLISVPNPSALMRQSSRLWLMLFLARVDGKSPVEYLSKDQQQFIRDFVLAHLTQPVAFEFLELHSIFHKQLSNLN